MDISLIGPGLSSIQVESELTHKLIAYNIIMKLLLMVH